MKFDTVSDFVFFKNYSKTSLTDDFCYMIFSRFWLWIIVSGTTSKFDIWLFATVLLSSEKQSRDIGEKHRLLRDNQLVCGSRSNSNFPLCKTVASEAETWRFVEKWWFEISSYLTSRWASCRIRWISWFLTLISDRNSSTWSWSSLRSFKHWSILVCLMFKSLVKSSTRKSASRSLKKRKSIVQDFGLFLSES